MFVDEDIKIPEEIERLGKESGKVRREGSKVKKN